MLDRLHRWLRALWAALSLAVLAVREGDGPVPPSQRP